MNREPLRVRALAPAGAVGLLGGWLVAAVTRPLPDPFRFAALVVFLAPLAFVLLRRVGSR
ncbi:hypothetical protein ACIPYS_32680 [Kitasatospora sp. NPDC089913]|uniref:hypothetical protein n=1 Tax=Kitasatospora sp. NPDC089913 TaxID=3364080 RepID=UPI00382586E5